MIYDVTHWENSGGHYLQTLLDAVALIPVIGSIKYTDEGVTIVKGLLKNTDNVTDVAKRIDESVGEALKNNVIKHYSVVEYKGTVKINGEIFDVSRKVYQRNDIDIDYFDRTTGLSNIERMQLGRPPIGSDGKPIQLHHILQKETGSVVEIR